jgi:Leucine-rich repeat (LRR) protein
MKQCTICSGKRVFWRETLQQHSLRCIALIPVVLFSGLLGACQRPVLKGGVIVDRRFFANMDSAAAHPSRVKKLFLSGKGLDTLPTSIKQFKNLETLIVSRNPHLNVADLVYKTKNLRKLRYVNLSFCELDSLPGEVGLLHHITVLDIAGNRLKSLPPSMTAMHSLREVVFCDYEDEFRQWSREEKLRAVVLLPKGQVILRDCSRGLNGRRVTVTKDKLGD